LRGRDVERPPRLFLRERPHDERPLGHRHQHPQLCPIIILFRTEQNKIEGIVPSAESRKRARSYGTCLSRSVERSLRAEGGHISVAVQQRAMLARHLHSTGGRNATSAKMPLLKGRRGQKGRAAYPAKATPARSCGRGTGRRSDAAHVEPTLLWHGGKQARALGRREATHLKKGDLRGCRPRVRRRGRVEKHHL